MLTKITSLHRITEIAALMVTTSLCPNWYCLSRGTTSVSILLLSLSIMPSLICSLMTTNRIRAKTLTIDLRRVITKNSISSINIINECKRITTSISISMEDKPHSTMAMLRWCYWRIKTLRSSLLTDRANSFLHPCQYCQSSCLTTNHQSALSITSLLCKPLKWSFLMI